MSVCEDESLSTSMECHYIRQPKRPHADGSCPIQYEKFDKGFLVPTCLPILSSSYICRKDDPRLCTRPRIFTTYPPIESAYPLSSF